MPDIHRTRVLIIGAGPAGYTAAIYAARASLEPVLVAGLQPGGQLTITTDVENYPGFAEAIQGPWLMEQMQRAGRACRHAQIVHDLTMSVDFSAPPFRVVGDCGTFPGRHLVIATGARRDGSASPRRSGSRARGFRPARPATASSIAASGSPWSGAATRRSKRRSPDAPRRQGHAGASPRQPRAEKSCNAGCSPTRKSRSSGTTWSRKCWARGSPRW